MDPWDWSPYLVGGGTRPDAITGLNAQLEQSLRQLYASAPDDVRNSLRITSGYRSDVVQQGLWDAALAKYGDPEIADNWVARPGASNHNRGAAADLKYLSPQAQAWVHDNAGKYGLHFPMDHEPWHVEVINGTPTVVAGPQNALAQQPSNPLAPQGQPMMPQQPQMSDYMNFAQTDPSAFMNRPNALQYQPIQPTSLRGA